MAQFLGALNPFLAAFIYRMLLPAVVKTGAPLDADAYCSLGNFLDESTQFPPNVVSLMDSYSYLILLGNEVNQLGVWQQVDLDSNNSNGRGTEVSQSMLACCI